MITALVGYYLGFLTCFYVLSAHWTVLIHPDAPTSGWSFITLLLLRMASSLEIHELTVDVPLRNHEDGDGFRLQTSLLH